MKKFKTESKRLLDLMINSIYTNKEIFLRELISNASDALDKLYIKALSANDTSINKADLKIDIYVDEDERSITISDNGIGMNKEDLEKNLGTIAHSGSLEFKSDEEIKESEEIDIIGQFGVGFYSSFMVADKVIVTSKAYGDDQAWVWECKGLDGYSIKEGEREGCGTTIKLFIRESSDESNYDQWLSYYSLKSLVKRYSDYIRYPIVMETTQTREKPRPEDAGDDYKPEYETVTERAAVNSMVPIWTRKKSDVSDEEYAEFYKATFHDSNDPMRVISLHAEGTLNYDALLFIPKEAPRDLYSKEFQKGLSLYSSNVLIMDKCEELLPDCFGFVRGIIDSPDLNLNISREMLQHDRQLTAIERKIEKKVKSELAKMRDDNRDEYNEFFKQFGYTLKYNVYSSYGMLRDLLGDLLMFHSARDKKFITLDEYIAVATEDQDKIYYAVGDTEENLEKTPLVKSVLDKGFDVLLCGSNVDEFCIMSLQNYGEKPFANIASGDLDFNSEEDTQAAKQADEENSDLYADMAATLGERVTKVVSSSILTEDAACITAGGDVSLAMEKYFQNVPDGADVERPKADRVLELNTKHPVFAKLKDVYGSEDVDKFEAYTKLLYDLACFAEGLQIDDTSEFTSAIYELMK